MQTCDPHGMSPRTFTPVLRKVVFIGHPPENRLAAPRSISLLKRLALGACPNFLIASPATAASPTPRCDAHYTNTLRPYINTTCVTSLSSNPVSIARRQQRE